MNKYYFDSIPIVNFRKNNDERVIYKIYGDMVYYIESAGYGFYLCDIINTLKLEISKYTDYEYMGLHIYLELANSAYSIERELKIDELLL